MAGSLEPIIHCDAPPYSVVRACKDLGFHLPLDVRWCRRSRLAEETAQRLSFLSLQKWKELFGFGKPRGTTCFCGQPVPLLESYTFHFFSQKQVRYLLGQCRCCRTIFWEETGS
jgi:hypothetical protein